VPPRSYQVIIIGGGHAGVEAAWAAANLLAGGAGFEPVSSIALITLDPSKIGVMSCNPAIGGLAKGQLVREIDALGGLMALATDATGIQFKVLNTSKGQAVHGPRAQCDKHAYADTIQALIASRPEIDIIPGSVEEILVERGDVRGVVVKPSQIANSKWQVANDATRESATPNPPLAPGHQHLRFGNLPFAISAPAVVLTTGTFMRGLMHTGESKTPGGRFGEAPATGISATLRALGFELGRLKTGTPPRLKKSSIDWDHLPAQYGDDPPVPFSDLSAFGNRQSASGPNAQCLMPNAAPCDLSASAPIAECRMPNAAPPLRAFPALPQLECRQTHTTAAIHDLIRANLHRAPMYSGQIESTGPRYCPSIEDKVVRFADRPTHGVFLEPESLRDDWIYCNGISTSLPADVQDAIVRSMPGCAHAEIYRYGYAVEYDMVRPHQIHATGETKLIAGLFLAGQINGTSGYEEAAAQGFIAGLNAARRALSLDPVTLGRDEAYIGVLMDDLITKTPVEPYRMFTSRAEHRLLLRADNAADRLTPRAIEWGLLDSTDLGRLRKDLFTQRQRDLRELNTRIDRIRIDNQPLSRLLRTPDFTVEDLARATDNGAPRASGGVLSTAFAERRYEAYIARQHAEIKRHAEMEHRRLPETIDYANLDSLRAEARAALSKFRPETFGQAGRLEGITPADLTLLAILVQKHRQRATPAMNESSSEIAGS